MKRILSLAFAGCLLISHTAEANSVADFLRRVGDTLVHGGKRQQARRAAKAKHPRDRTSAEQSDPNPALSPTPTIAPAPVLVRRATAAPVWNGPDRDLRYGVPVPEKPGFVRSPWAPTGGFVDVTGFPRGAEVQDPYSGKIFLTP